MHDAHSVAGFGPSAGAAEERDGGYLAARRNSRVGAPHIHGERSMPFQTSRVILFGDCDPGGVVYTPRIAHFVVEACLDFLSHALGGPAARRLFALGILPPARALSIEFLHPMVWDEVIAIEVVVERLGEHSFTLAVDAANAEGTRTFRASITQVTISPETRRPVPLPLELRTALESTGRG
ncbi:acyl-CoA thioesterase [Lysobacter capsici]|uniref:acyl-CoA thioesterase n=2 Tax=Lysobacter capsici TaxID=435897 RepID=UPI0018DFC3A2|nr:thioesterase family protein [Lysobacter capsici]